MRSIANRALLLSPPLAVEEVPFAQVVARDSELVVLDEHVACLVACTLLVDEVQPRKEVRIQVACPPLQKHHLGIVLHVMWEGAVLVFEQRRQSFVVEETRGLQQAWGHEVEENHAFKIVTDLRDIGFDVESGPMLVLGLLDVVDNVAKRHEIATIELLL